MRDLIHNLFKTKNFKILAAAGLFLGLVFYSGFIRAPLNFPVGESVLIEEGTTIQEAAKILKDKEIILSPILFSIMSHYLSDIGVYSGTYTFEKKQSLFSVWYRAVTGKTGEPAIRVTIPEGATTREIAILFSEKIPNFDGEYFRDIAKEKEGYLFPETYIVGPGITEEAVVELMEETFYNSILEIQEDIDAFGKPLHDVVTMASLLEREARLYETKQIVAGILWKRIEIGMALQVDAVFGYIYDTETFSPTFDQLTATDSPYNTYKYRGLPPGAIASPGLESLKAAVNPIETPYLYYLTGIDGMMYYGSTFEEHKENRKYLR